MQPPSSVEDENANVSDTSDSCIASVSEDRRAFVKPNHAGEMPSEYDAAKTDLMTSAKPSILLSTRSPGPYRGKCLYQSRKCENERAVKRNGKPHNLCDMHRNKQNRHQRKFDAKKFSRKRRRDSKSEKETGEDKSAHEEPSAWHTLPSKSYGDISNVVVSTRRNYHSSIGAVPRPPTLPPIQNLRGPVLPQSPALSYSTSSSVRSEVGSDEYVVPSEFRTGDAPIIHCRQQPRRAHRGPYLQYQVQPPPPGYSRSEFGAAGTLVESYYSAIPRAASNVGYYRDDVPRAGELRSQNRTITQVLPSLDGSRLESPNLSRRFTENELCPPQRFASVEATSSSSVSMSRSTSAGTGLPYLRSLNLARGPMSPLSFSRSR